MLYNNMIKHQPVSIHAPVRERPVKAFHDAAGKCGFNSRSREGATKTLTTQILKLLFQFTLP